MILTPQFIVPLFSGIITIGIGVFISAVDFKNMTYRRFLYAMIALGAFTIFAGFFNAFALSSLLWYDFLLWSSVFIPPTVFALFATFPSSKEVLSKNFIYLLWMPVAFLLSPMILFPREFGAAVAQVSGLPVQLPGHFYPITLAYYVVYFALGFWFLLRTFKKSQGRFRAQIGAGIVGVFTATIGMFITNVFAPWFGFSQLFNFYWLGPLFVVIGVSSMAYMIFEGHKVYVRLLPVIVMALALIVALVGQMIIAPTPSSSVFAGIILAGTLLLVIFLIRDVLVEETDRTELERLLGEINKANQALRSADETKTEFLSIASHHLRTPLTLIKWTLTEFLEGNYGPLTDEQKRLFYDLIKKNEQLVRFVHSMLDVTRIESGRVELHLDKINMFVFLEETIAKLMPLAKDYGIALSKDFPNELPEIIVDPEALSRVFENVIENGIIYNKPGGSIHVEARADKKEVVVVVKDTGIGISKEELLKIGEKFFRSSGAKKQVAEGTGLGVFTAREILKMHKGTIVYESENGKGTTVTMRLPVKNGNEAKFAKIQKEKKEDGGITPVYEAPKKIIKEREDASPRPMTVMFIDDDSVMQALIQERFSIEHIALVSAKDAEEGMQKMRETLPNLILLDLLLPGRDGFSVLEEIKKDPRLSQIPVVILTNLAQQSEIKKGMSLGAVLYLVKTSCTPAKVVEETKRVLEGKKK